MNSTHTPGPWIVPDGGIRPTVYTEDGQHIATLYDCGDVMEANARLIAAAPDMYDALKALFDEDGPVRVTVAGKLIDLVAVVDRARAALAKAEGR